ncbi:hypothetical protein F4818DRAFT_419679 [Hypoxylon cercidicola]|nr:hypothetical protein F4818DRAFT_419679 [Hypoxylon cercidicola]
MGARRRDGPRLDGLDGINTAIATFIMIACPVASCRHTVRLVAFVAMPSPFVISRSILIILMLGFSYVQDSEREALRLRKGNKNTKIKYHTTTGDVRSPDRYNQALIQGQQVTPWERANPFPYDTSWEFQ